MAERIAILCRLREGVEPGAYEGWLERVDLPAAARVDAIRRYSVTRLGGVLDGAGPCPYDYLEVLDVTSLDDYRASAGADPAMQALLAEWAELVSDYVVVSGTPLTSLDKD